MKKLLTFLLFTFPFLLLPYLSKAQIAINNTAANPDASAILDLKTGNAGVNKGFLPQSVALTNVTTAAPVISPATGLIVFSSTAPTGGNGTGYYYWNGTAWASLNNTFGGAGTSNYVARWTPNATSLGIGLIQDNNNGVAIDTTPVAGTMLFVNSSTGNAINGISANDTGVQGYSGGSIGIYGNGVSYGVYGFSPNTFGSGVYGENDNMRGNGVEGNSTNGTGVYGLGGTYGVYGTSTNASGIGVRGVSNTKYGVDGYSLDSIGVHGYSNNNIGVYGLGGKYGGKFIATKGQGVFSYSNEAAGDSATGITYGVYGYASDISGLYAGVFGRDDNGYGVEGYSLNSIAVSGTGEYGGGSFAGFAGPGVYGSGSIGGEFNASAGQGVFSFSSSAAGDSSVGITCGGYFTATSGPGVSGTGTTNGGTFVATAGGAVHGSGTTNGGVFVASAGDGVHGTGTTFGGKFDASAGQGVYSNSSSAAGDSAIGKTYGGNFTATAGQGVFGQGTTYGGNFYASNGIGVDGVGETYGARLQASKGQGVYSSSSSAAGDSSTGKTFGVFGNGAIGAEFTGTTYGLLVTNGNVGIGCITPFYTLDVNGNIRASGSVYYGGTACSNAGTAYTKPDYVFEPDYKKTYSPFEIEEFIIANGHLPWVTSATDDTRENSGSIDMTRMSFQTLEAVENTQMQIIEQQKTIVSQQAAIDKLNKQVADLTNILTQLINKQK
jgi:hypothetical protein